MYVSNFLNLFSNKFTTIDIYVYNNKLHKFEIELDACGSIAEIEAGEYSYYDVVTYCSIEDALYIKGEKEVANDTYI